MNDCSCLSCRAGGAIRRHGRKAATRLIRGLLALVLVSGALFAGHRAAFPPEADVWFDKMIRLAVIADEAYDAIDEDWREVRPRNGNHFISFVDEVVNQIHEEGASHGPIYPAGFEAMDYGPGRRSGVAGTYHPFEHVIGLNGRFFTAAWDRVSWFGVMVHELVHAQGYLTSESQTELIAIEVVAAMANLGYPGAKADLLDGLRRDALAMAYYIARFEGGPRMSTVGPGNPAFQMEPDPAPKPDEGKLARLDTVRRQIFTPAEYARSEKRLRWWNERADEYQVVLEKYVARVVTPLITAACGSGVVDEQFTRHQLYAGMKLLWTGKEWVVARVHEWRNPLTMPRLAVDDLAFVLRELKAC